jgi:WD40 repeat protein
LWDVASGKLLRLLEGHDTVVHAVAFAPGGKVLASAGDDGVVRLYEVDTGKLLHQLKGHAADVSDVVFSPDGTLLASAGRGGKIHLWDPDTGKELRRWEAGPGFGSGLAFTPDGKVLASGGDSCIRLWDPATGKEINPATGHTGHVHPLLFAPHGKTLISCGHDKKVLEWDLATGQQRVLGVRSMTAAADFSPDGSILAESVYNDPCIRLRDTATGKELLILETPAKQYRELCFAPGGKLLASSTKDGIRLWDLTTGKTLHHFQQEQFSPSPVAFSPDGTLLAFGGNDQTIRLVDVATGKKVRHWQRPEDFLRILLFSPDGQSLISYGNPGSDLTVWATATGKQLAQFKGFERILCLAFSPGGRTLAVIDLARHNMQGPDERTTCMLHLLEVLSGQEVRRLAMAQESVWSLAFAPDGRTLATGGGDSTILLWDMTARGLAGKVKAAGLTAADLDQLWSDLAGDAATADKALTALVLAAKESAPFLRERLRPASVPAEQVARLIADLDSESFSVRSQAVRALEELGEAAEAALRQTLAGKCSLEVRQRIEPLLEKRNKAALRSLRAIDALEQIGTAQARQVLAELARSAPHPQVAFAAGAALERLAKFPR